MRYQQSFPTVVPQLRADSLCITHPSATFLCSKLQILVRLACMKHAASVHPEPGSNSPLSEKFMSLVHIPMNRSTSFYFSCPSHFFKINRYLSSSAILLSMFYSFLLSKESHKKFRFRSLLFRRFSDIFHPITSIYFVNLFFIFFLRVFGIFKITIQNHQVTTLQLVIICYIMYQLLCSWYQPRLII